MDKDNSQEPMITSNSPSLEKGREKVYYTRIRPSMSA